MEHRYAILMEILTEIHLNVPPEAGIHVHLPPRVKSDLFIIYVNLMYIIDIIKMPFLSNHDHVKP